MRNSNGWGQNFMKIKPALKYYLGDYRNVLLVMYACVYVFAVLMIIGTNRFKNSSGGGLEFISIITLFVLGLSSFKPYLKMFSANGTSRRTIFCAAILTLGSISVIMALIDTLNTLLFSRFSNYQSMFAQAYYRGVLSVFHWTGYTFSMLMQQFLWSIFACFWIATVGFLITVLYYRMNKGLKIAVSVGIPVLLLFVLPALDRNLWSGCLSHTEQTFFNFVWGYSNGCNPFIGMASMLVFAAVNAAFAWLLVRRASVKE